MKKRMSVAVIVILGLAMMLLGGWRFISSGKNDAVLIPFLSSQVKAREAMLSGLRTHDIDAFCDAYWEFRRIAKEEPLLLKGGKLAKGGKDYWTVLLSVVDSQLIRDLADLSELCEDYCPY